MNIKSGVNARPCSRLKSSSLLLIAGFLAATSAHAIVNDPPYFDLYLGGDDTFVALCGVSGCDSSLNMIVEVAAIKPAGSGVRDTFLRLQNDNANVLTETAYSTDGKETDPTFLQNDADYVNGAKDSTAGNRDDFNNAVLLSDLDIKQITVLGQGVVDVYQIVLDINEPGGDKKLIRLDEFEIHLSSDGFLSQYDNVVSAGVSSFSDGGYRGLVFDMDFEKTNPGLEDVGGLILDSTAGGNGSGDEDYSFFLPVELFTNAIAAGVGDGKYMHLVSTFGEADAATALDGSAQSGFEEWAAELGADVPDPDPGNPIPLPGTALLMAIGSLGLLRRKRC
ncbi:MAG: PEP-CTERM sorting domain-containing protein [Motiliproteus sp.]